MNNISANQVYSNTEFDALLTEPTNNFCFDCGSSPASWASVNNSIYLCLNCAGNHRSFGVNISYIRSITIDTWNEAQIRHMKVGGNKRLSDLLAVYEVPKNILPEVLYTTKLLEYHRGMIKSDVNNTSQLIPIKIEEALNPMDFQNKTPNPNTHSKYQSVSSSNDFDQANTNQSGGFLSSMSSAFTKVVDTGKYYATNVKDKVNDLDMNDIKSKIQTVGAKSKDALINAGHVVKETTIKGVDLIKDKSGNVISKGIEIGVKAFLIFRE
jgi:ADP-ribosylation factor GTPase-activating protein 1